MLGAWARTATCALHRALARARRELPRSGTHRREPRALAAAAAASAPSPGELGALLAAGAIDQPTYDARRASYEATRASCSALKGTRRAGARGASSATLDGIAARGQLTPSRLPALWLTLERNREWWITGPLLASGRRVGFEGSQLVWQYFPGEGIQIQVLGTSASSTRCGPRASDNALSAAVDELLPLAAERAGGLAWEYYFPFDGGAPAVGLGLAQGTALQALARAATRLDRETEVFPVTSRALAIFQTPPPEGVRVPAGARRALPAVLVRPRAADPQRVHPVAQRALRLRAAWPPTRRPGAVRRGRRRARQEVPTYDTGAWSLYSRGTVTRESDLGYHTLLRDFLESLCNRTGEPVYCDAERALHALPRPAAGGRATHPRAARRALRPRCGSGCRRSPGVTLRITRGAEARAHALRRRRSRAAAHSLGWQVPRRARRLHASS